MRVHGLDTEIATPPTTDYRQVMSGLTVGPAFTVLRAEHAELQAYRQLRREVFVAEQGIFSSGASESDDVDDDPRTIVLVAVSRSGDVLGGVRLAPATPVDIGWWRGSRLAVRTTNRADGGATRGVGAALVRAACAHAAASGALRFEATVQSNNEEFFRRIGWELAGTAEVQGIPHVRMNYPMTRIADLLAATKNPLGPLLAGWTQPGAGFLGDDGAPVPGSTIVAACDAIVPAMVERDPEWAGWCGVLVNVNDLAAMGAAPVGLLDAVAAADAESAARVLAGVRAASEAYGVPVIGGHTQLGVPAALTITALGNTPDPVPAAGGRPGDDVSLLADLGGSWRPGYTGRQWDSTSTRSPEELRHMVTALIRHRPAAAKDVSMAGVVGTLGMLAEACGCGAELDVAAVPAPEGAVLADWLTCFPGFALLTADRPGAPAPKAEPAISATCGRLTEGAGVTLRWPDGETTIAVAGGATGLGPA